MTLATQPALTERWTPMRSHPVQEALWQSDARFVTVPCGRRSGKTEIAKRKAAKKTIQHDKTYRGRFILAAPTRVQAKKIFWEDIKALIPDWALLTSKRDSISESELTIKLWNATIEVCGMDEPQRIEGSPIDGIVLDEYANMKEHAWPLHVRPALYTEGREPGWAILTGVPEGRNHYYDAVCKAKKDTTGTWANFAWVSADILPEEEIKLAREDLDEQTFNQEYNATFESFQGRAYYKFDFDAHAIPNLHKSYDPLSPLEICFDFNVAPGVAAICQELRIEEQGPRFADICTVVLGEVWIPNNSNTIAVCNKIIKDWGNHQGMINCYGDATGGARGTSQVRGSDWDIIKDELTGHFGDRVVIKIDRANPRERQRVNAVNSRLQSATKKISILFDKKKAIRTITDLDSVPLLKGGSGEIDKKANADLTHISDALGYYIHKRFPVRGANRVRSRPHRV